jgi:hypothetical protein
MPINKLKQNSITILNQIANLVSQVNDNDYSTQLDLLSNNTIAKHIRHILELYVQLIAGIEQKEINYDKRERNLLIEHNRTYTLDFIMELSERINAIQYIDDVLYLNTLINEDEILVKSSIERELTYNIEHAIHHMAIIQIACKHYFHYIQLDKNFGVAYATIQYQNTCAQ